MTPEPRPLDDEAELELGGTIEYKTPKKWKYALGGGISLLIADVVWRLWQ